MIVNDGDIIDVWFSCGVASAVAAKLTLDKYRERCIVRVLNNPVVEEDEDNRRFLLDIEKWIKTKIYIVTNSKFPDFSADTVWRQRRYMSGVEGAPCTLHLKKIPRQLHEEQYPANWLVLGFTSDEIKRSENFRKFERNNLLPILIENNLTKAKCFSLIKEAGIEIPRIYNMGYPNANCIGCVKATSPTYWNHVRNNHPEIFDKRASLSREIGAKLVRVKGKRKFLDELLSTDLGAPMKNLSAIECGIFCEEKIQ